MASLNSIGKSSNLKQSHVASKTLNSESCTSIICTPTRAFQKPTIKAPRNPELLDRKETLEDRLAALRKEYERAQRQIMLKDSLFIQQNELISELSASHDRNQKRISQLKKILERSEQFHLGFASPNLNSPSLSSMNTHQRSYLQSNTFSNPLQYQVKAPSSVSRLNLISSQVSNGSPCEKKSLQKSHSQTNLCNEKSSVRLFSSTCSSQKNRKGNIFNAYQSANSIRPVYKVDMAALEPLERALGQDFLGGEQGRNGNHRNTTIGRSINRYKFVPTIRNKAL